MKNLDLLIESAAISGQLAAGVAPGRIAAQTSLGARAVTVLAGRTGKNIKKAKQPPWTKEEDAFIAACMGSLTDEEIGQALDRTAAAVHIRRERELGLPVRAKSPDIMTANQIGMGMGV